MRPKLILKKTAIQTIRYSEHISISKPDETGLKPFVDDNSISASSSFSPQAMILLYFKINVYIIENISDIIYSM